MSICSILARKEHANHTSLPHMSGPAPHDATAFQRVPVELIERTCLRDGQAFVKWDRKQTEAERESEYALTAGRAQHPFACMTPCLTNMPAEKIQMPEHERPIKTRGDRGHFGFS